MHEMGLAVQILGIVAQSLPPDGEHRVQSINLRVGKLNSVVPESLRMCWEAVVLGGPAEGSKLVLTEVGVTVECCQCDELSDIERPPFQCSACGSGEVEMVTGSELVVESIVVERQDNGVQA